MKILSMTATFGKLEQQTLTLQPGLNVIHAPNEWGKSTWCAFLLNMLYGVDTRERSKQDALADKDRYAPWSGAAMSGRMDIEWNGQKITIERTSNARIPLGVFRAYETETGLDIPELTAANCGQTLLGVERSVFTRAGFLRLADMPVTQDDALRRRLNNLVTTGDESGDSDKLGQTLKDLKNKCRSNRANGLLPEAEGQRDRLRNQLWDLQDLEENANKNQARQQELEQQRNLLENHRKALEFDAFRENARRIEEANSRRDAAAQALDDLTQQCRQLPDRTDAAQRLRQLEQLQLQKSALDAEALPPVPEAPEAPAPFRDMDADQALQQSGSDKSAFDMLSRPLSPIPLILMIVSLAAAAVICFIKPLLAIPFPVIALIFLLVHLRGRKRQKQDRTAVAQRYGTLPPEQWISLAQQYQAQQDQYETQVAQQKALASNLESRIAQWQKAVAEAADGQALQDAVAHYTDVLSKHDALENAQRTYQQAQQHAEALSAVTKAPEKPDLPDTLTLSQQETQQAITAAEFELKQLQLQLGQYQGQMEALGQPAAIKAKLDAVNMRIARLERCYNALELAQNALYKATLTLQRRFSPQITKRAQALFRKLTGDRYQRITLSEDLSLQTAAEDEITLRELRRRSDGTVDQLYLALRLAVAEELTPNAPLVLDDALVRFDDDRLAQAISILQEAAESKQVILFTCQNREQALLANK